MESSDSDLYKKSFQKYMRVFFFITMQLHPADLESLAIAKRVIANVGNAEDSYRLLMSRLSSSDDYETRKRKLKELDHELSGIAEDENLDDSGIRSEKDRENTCAKGSLRTPPQTPPKSSKRKRLVVDSSDDDVPAPNKRRPNDLNRKDSASSSEGAALLHKAQVPLSRTRMGSSGPVYEPNSLEKLNFKTLSIAMVSPVRETSETLTSKKNKKDIAERYIKKWGLVQPTNMHIDAKQWENYDKLRLSVHLPTDI